MKRMETYQTSISLSEESSQMFSLNKRLETYLSRVKSLEEENEMLREEIHHLKSTRSESCWVRKYHDEIMTLRNTLDDGHQNMVQAELARDSIYQEIGYVKALCLQEKQAQEDVKKELAESKKQLEEEKRAQIWLKERLVQLEDEMEDILKAHEEEKALMEEEISSYSQRLENFKIAPVAFQPVNVEDYAHQLSQIWQGAAEGYKSEVSTLETSLAQANENLRKVLDENKQSQLQLQNLDRELQGLKTRKDLLEELLSTQWLEQQDEEGKLQLEIESLEKEKQDLRVEITQVLEDRQQLMHLKMSLSLEVATYRSLLEAENTRIYSPSTDYKISSSFNDSAMEQNTLRKRQADNSKKPVSRDYRLKANRKQSAESSTPKRYLNVKSTSFASRASPVTKEFQKVSSVLQSQSLKYTKASSAKAATPLPTVEGISERRPQTGDVFRKSTVETISRDSPKAVTEETVSNDTKVHPVSSRNVDNTIDTGSKKTEHLGVVESGKMDLLESSVKTVEKHHKVVSAFVVEEEVKIKVQDAHEKPHEDKINLDVPQTTIDSPREGFENVVVDHITEKHEVVREIVDCQQVYLEKQEILDALEYQNMETTIKDNAEERRQVLDFTEPHTTDTKDHAVTSSQINEQEDNTSAETEPKQFSSDVVADHGLDNSSHQVLDFEDTTSIDIVGNVDPSSDGKKDTHHWADDKKESLQLDQGFERSDAEQAEAEGGLQDEEVTVGQQVHVLSALKENSNQLFNDGGDITEESPEDAEEVIQEFNDLEHARESSRQEEDILDGPQSFGIEHAVDQWTDDKLESPQLVQEEQKVFELDHAEQHTDDLKYVDPDDEVTACQEIHVLSAVKDNNQLVDSEDQEAQEDNYVDQEDSSLKHVESKYHLPEDELTEGHQFHMLGALKQDSSPLLDNEDDTLNENQEEQKIFELNEKRQESQSSAEEHKSDNISDTKDISHEHIDNEQSSQTYDDKEVVDQFNDVDQDRNQVSENFENSQLLNQEEEKNFELSDLEQHSQVSYEQQISDIINVTEEITQEFTVNVQAMQFYDNKEVMDQLEDVQQETNQLSEKVEDSQQPSREDLKNLELRNTEPDSHNISGNDGNSEEYIENEQVIQSLEGEEVASLLSNIDQNIYEFTENVQESKQEEQKSFELSDAEKDNISLADEQSFDKEQSVNQFCDLKEDSRQSLVEEEENTSPVELKSSESKLAEEDGEETSQENYEVVSSTAEECTKSIENEVIVHSLEKESELDAEQHEDGSTPTKTEEESQLPENDREEGLSGSDNMENITLCNESEPGIQESGDRTLFNEEVEQDSHTLVDDEQETKLDNDLHSYTEAIVSFQQESKDEYLSQPSGEREVSQEDYKVIPTVEEYTASEKNEEVKQSVEEASDLEQTIADRDASLLTSTVPESQLLGNEVEESFIGSDNTENNAQFIEPEPIIEGDSEAFSPFNKEGGLDSHKVDEADQVSGVDYDHLSDTEAKISFQPEKEDEFLNQSGEEKEGGQKPYEVVSTADEYAEFEDNDEIIQSVQKESVVDQSVVFSLNIIQNNLRFTSENNEIEPEPQQQNDELCNEKTEPSGDVDVDETKCQPFSLNNDDIEHHNLNGEEVISENKGIVEKEQKQVNIEAEEVRNEDIYQDFTFSAQQQDPSNLDKENQAKYIEPEINEQRVEQPTDLLEPECETIIVELKKAQELAENPTEILHFEGPIEQQREFDDIQAASNLEDENSKSDESMDSQDISIFSQKSEEFEISKDYQLEQTLPDTTPLPNLDDEFDELADNEVILASEQPEVGTAPQISEYSEEKVQTNQELDSSLESQSSQIISEEIEQSRLSLKDEVCNIEPEDDDQQAERPKDQFEIECVDNFVEHKQEPDFSAENSSEILESDEPVVEMQKQYQDSVFSKLENENSESEESMNSQEEVLIDSRKSESESSQYYQLGQTLSDTTPLSDLTEKLGNLAEEHVQLTSDLEGRSLNVDEATNENTFFTETIELVPPPEPSDTELFPALDTDTRIVAEDTTSGLNQNLNHSEDSEDSTEKEEYIIKSQTDTVTKQFTLEQTTELKSDDTKTEDDHIDHNGGKGDDVEVTDDLVEKEPVIESTHELKDDDNISTDVLNLLGEKSEIQDTITLDNTQESVKAAEESIISESDDPVSSDDSSPNVTTVSYTPELDDSRTRITEEIGWEVIESSEEVERTEFENVEIKEIHQRETLSTSKLVPDAERLESQTSDEEKDTTGESSDSSFDSNGAFEREAFQEHTAVLEYTTERQRDTKTVNGLHEHTVVQATLDLEDHMFNGHSNSEHSEIVISELKTIVRLEGDIVDAHTQDIMEESVIKFAMSEGKSEGLFQSLLETSEHKEGSRLEEASEIKNAIHAAVEESYYTKKVINPYLSDTDFDDQPQVKSSLVDEDLKVGTTTNQEANETQQAILDLKFSQQKEDSWSSNEQLD